MSRSSWWLWKNQGAVLDQVSAHKKQQWIAEKAEERAAPIDVCPPENPVGDIKVPGPKVTSRQTAMTDFSDNH